MILIGGFEESKGKVSFGCYHTVAITPWDFGETLIVGQASCYGRGMSKPHLAPETGRLDGRRHAFPLGVYYTEPDV